MMTFGSRVLRAAAALAFAVLPFASSVAAVGASEYPSRPIILVVPFGPGSVTDTLARISAKGLSDALGQPVVVENKSGAGGNIGAAAAARAAPDGYTLLLGPTSTNAVNPSLFKNLRFDPLRDFIAVSNVATVANVLVVNPDVPVTSVKQLIALAAEKDLSYASTGNGGSMHLSGELFKSMTQTNFLHIPYGGGGAALNDLLPGRVQVMFCNLPLCLPHIKSGELRALAITSPQRSPLLPEVPSMAEAGLPQYEVSGWFGLFVPAGTDPAIVDKLNYQMRNILEKPQIKAQLMAQGAEPAGGSSDEFGVFVKAEHDKWAKVINDAGITLE
ncbi:tripartite tricarboxylate transporter substrate binding protein [Candidimonas sp. SYP-B2681]|uniref:Bug family tripartite tricarboxylate transporter substrate binding protein n=1 Tax=Candidimonas sp. SYP-B2681 TaxID=2497686 RepID=UPI000F894D11|nr:tripartite tricarboxylate transporter substrate binding protein [Candidimonas sp. SYP-B2681]RTZ47626.1 tripartite tricarboxylate transporter substrate binding protein [Candidimonas sp. SYP-B2681]